MKNLGLQRELDDLRARYGVTLDRLTADEIAGLVDCTRRIADPYGAAGVSLIDIPVARVRGVDFRPLSVGASVWLSEYAERWWGDDPTCYFWALVYALVHANDRDAFADLTDRGAARAAIVRTCLRLALSRSEVEDAVDKALGRVGDLYDTPASKERKEARTDWAGFVARLETQTGIPSDEWLWGRSAAYAQRAYQDLHSYAAWLSQSSAKVRVFDAMDKAISALARLKKSIRDRILAEDEQTAQQADKARQADTPPEGGAAE